MIRPVTCVCLVLAAGSGLYLYQTKHRAQLLDREIARVLKQADAARDRITVLRNEWAGLNEPESLAKLSQQHLGLRNLLTTQFVAAGDLGARLPPPVSPGTIFLPSNEPPAETVQLASAPIVPVPAAVPAPATAPAPTPAREPAREPAAVRAASPPSPVLPAAQHPAPRPPAVAPAPALRAAAPAPAPLAPPRAITAPVLAVNATPMQVAQPAPGSIGEAVLRAGRVAREAPAPVYAAIPATASAASPAVASALGGLRAALPAPVPYTGH